MTIDKKNIKTIKKQNILLYLTIFNSLYKTLNIDKTSKVLGLSKSSTSKYLSKLEKFLNKKLFYRNGRKGLKITNEGQILHEHCKQLSNIIPNIKNLFLEKRNIIYIAMHPLFFKSHFLKFFNKKNIKEKDLHIDISIYCRDDAIELLQDDKIDIIFYPIDETSILSIKKNFKVIKLSQYKMCLYVHKDNIIAKKKEKDLNWEDAKNLTILPIAKKITSQMYYNIDAIRANKISSSTFDLNFLYTGLKENLWTVGVGEEIEDCFDMSEFSKKRIYKTNLFDVKQHWYVIYKKENEKKLFDFLFLLQK